MARVPPEDPESWSDEEWIAWLEETDTEPDDDGVEYAPKPRSPGATMLGNAMVGLHDIIYGQEHRDVTIVEEAAGEPLEPEAVDVDIVPDDPDASTITVRPWLLDEHTEDDERTEPAAPKNADERTDGEGTAAST
jgi:hypothetical protein